jgi:hypothetical protein
MEIWEAGASTDDVLTAGFMDMGLGVLPQWPSEADAELSGSVQMPLPHLNKGCR